MPNCVQFGRISYELLGEAKHANKWNLFGLSVQLDVALWFASICSKAGNEFVMQPMMRDSNHDFL